MLKKIVLLVALFVLPLCAMGQSKFGHMNSQEVMVVMPEFIKAQADLETLSQQYQKEFENSREEFTKKYQGFVAQADSLPKNIAERRQRDLADMDQRLQAFQQEAYQALQQAQQEAMVPIQQKLTEAIDAVGKAEGVVYIFDVASTPLAFIGAESIDLTAKVKAQLGIK